MIKRCNESSIKKRHTIIDIDAKVAEGKTVVSKQIKTTLGIVEAFGATHLTNVLVLHGLNDTKYTLNAEQLANDLKLASTAEKDKLAPVPKVVVSLMASTLQNQASTLLPKTPEFSQTIEYLKEHPEVSDWVGEGLQLHDGKTSCEFCGNQ
jgi:wobble nucleotide-excising tRNase